MYTVFCWETSWKASTWKSDELVNDGFLFGVEGALRSQLLGSIVWWSNRLFCCSDEFDHVLYFADDLYFIPVYSTALIPTQYLEMDISLIFMLRLCSQIRDLSGFPNRLCLILPVQLPSVLSGLLG